MITLHLRSLANPAYSLGEGWHSKFTVKINLVKYHNSANLIQERKPYFVQRHAQLHTVVFHMWDFETIPFQGKKQLRTQNLLLNIVYKTKGHNPVKTDTRKKINIVVQYVSDFDTNHFTAVRAAVHTRYSVIYYVLMITTKDYNPVKSDPSKNFLLHAQQHIVVYFVREFNNNQFNYVAAVARIIISTMYYMVNLNKKRTTIQ